MIREVDVANLPVWLQSPRSQIDRLLSIYHLQSAKFVPKQPNQPNLAMELLIRILTDIRDLPENPRDNVYLTCKKLFSDFESMYPSSTFSRVSFICTEFLQFLVMLGLPHPSKFIIIDWVGNKV